MKEINRALRAIAFPRVDLPPLDQHGPWPLARKPTQVETEIWFADSARKAWSVAEEERRRRMEIEEELAIGQTLHLEREPEIRYIERKVYTPMPPREVRGRTLVIDRATSQRLEPASAPKDSQEMFFGGMPPYRSLAPGSMTEIPAPKGVFARLRDRLFSRSRLTFHGVAV